SDGVGVFDHFPVVVKRHQRDDPAFVDLAAHPRRLTRRANPGGRPPRASVSGAVAPATDGSVLGGVGVVAQECRDVVVAGVVAATADGGTQVRRTQDLGLRSLVEAGRDDGDPHLVGCVFVVRDAEQYVDVVDLGSLRDLLYYLGGV